MIFVFCFLTETKIFEILTIPKHLPLSLYVKHQQYGRQLMNAFRIELKGHIYDFN